MQTSPEPETSILFVRHAQTIWNQEHRYAGSSEVALAPEATRQIAELTDQIKHYKIGAIYASPLTRCQITIRPTAHHLNLPIVLTDELKERNLGTWEGHSPEELFIHQSGYHFPESAYNGQFRISGAEPLEDLEERVRSFMRRVREQHPGQIVLAATHAGVIWVMQKYIVRNPPKTVAWPGNCSHYVVRTDGQGFVLEN